MSEVEGERVIAEAELASTGKEAISENDVRRLVESLGDMAGVLADANPKDKAEVYAGLGITITYNLNSGKSLLKHDPRSVCNRVCRRGVYGHEYTGVAWFWLMVGSVGSIGVPLP